MFLPSYGVYDRPEPASTRRQVDNLGQRSSVCLCKDGNPTPRNARAFLLSSPWDTARIPPSSNFTPPTLSFSLPNSRYFGREAISSLIIDRPLRSRSIETDSSLPFLFGGDTYRRSILQSCGSAGIDHAKCWECEARCFLIRYFSRPGGASQVF